MTGEAAPSDNPAYCLPFPAGLPLKTFIIFTSIYLFLCRVYEHLLACMYVHQVCARLVPGRWWKPEEDLRSLGKGVADICDLPCAGLEVTLGPL